MRQLKVGTAVLYGRKTDEGTVCEWFVRFQLLLAAYEGNEKRAISLLNGLQDNRIRLNSNVLSKKVNAILMH